MKAWVASVEDRASAKLPPLRALLGAASALLLGCTAGATPRWGTGALMRTEGAQFVPGPMPTADVGPNVDSIDLTTTTIWPGYANKLVRGSLDPSSTAVALALSGDEGHWIVTAGVPDYSTPTLPSFRATTSFSPALLPGAYNLAARAVDAHGNFGPTRMQPLTAIAQPPSALRDSSSLEIALAWDSESDLDLHVVDPLGEEIYHGAKTTLAAFPPPGSSSSNSQGYGVLDIDSNGDCEIDGRRRERVLWSGVPPSGHYIVRVDAKSLCGAPIVYWTVQVSLAAAVIDEGRGVSVDTDTWGPHDRGAGVLALTFDVP